MAIHVKLLHCALALAEHKNFRRAAQARHISQPSLSRYIQEIERSVGTRIFERTTSGVIPTDAGKILLEHAREVVARSADLEREMELLRGLEKGELRIGAGTYPSIMVADKAVARMVQDHPAVRLHIIIDNRENLLPVLKKRELDIAVIIVDGMSEDADLDVTRMNRYPAYVVVRGGHPLAKSNKTLTLQSVLKFPSVMSSRLPSALLKRFLIGTFGDQPIPASAKSFPTIACESVAMMKTIIARTDAITVLPLNAVMPEVESRELVVLPFSVPLFHSTFGIVRMAHRSLSPVGETFVRMLQEEDAKLFDFERKAAAKLFAAPRHARTRARSATTGR
jgi:DNA-binding transcriptional LysR family regulator